MSSFFSMFLYKNKQNKRENYLLQVTVNSLAIVVPIRQVKNPLKYIRKMFSNDLVNKVLFSDLINLILLQRK